MTNDTWRVGWLWRWRYRVLSGVLIGLRFLVKGWLNELRPNGGASMKDQITRLEKRVDDLFILISKS
jgi:hypothetical protein